MFVLVKIKRNKSSFLGISIILVNFAVVISHK